MSAFFTFLFIINFLATIFLLFVFYKNSLSKSSKTKIISDGRLKVNIHRFNPFDDIGGDQSFILTILDENNSGAVVTSLHNRDITRIYAKPIKDGEGDNITLSKEEKLAIVKTIKG